MHHPETAIRHLAPIQRQAQHQYYYSTDAPTLPFPRRVFRGWMGRQCAGGCGVPSRRQSGCGVCSANHTILALNGLACAACGGENDCISNWRRETRLVCEDGHKAAIGQASRLVLLEEIRPSRVAVEAWRIGQAQDMQTFIGMYWSGQPHFMTVVMDAAMFRLNSSPRPHACS